MTLSSVPGIVFHTRAREGMQRGVNLLVEAIRPTLGPFPRVVAVEPTFRHNTPELLDCAGTIARRIIALPDRDADVGAMLLRNLLWRVHEEAGDGTATAAVLFQAIYNRGLAYLAAGGDTMGLRRGLERGLEIILAELDRQTEAIAGRGRLAQLAAALCLDEGLAQILGEVLDMVGEDGGVELRRSHGRQTERQYIEGCYWPGGVLSPHLLLDQTRQRSDLADVELLLSDLDLDDPRQLMPVLHAAMERQARAMLIVAGSLSDTTTAMLIAANREPERFRAVAVRTPGAGPVEQAEALEDLALLTSGRPLLKAAGDTLRGLRQSDLGRARRAWGDRAHMGVTGGGGDPRALRTQIATLKAAAGRAEEPTRRSALAERVARLLGGSATVTIGGSTESEIALGEERARRTVRLLRAALREGVLPGGGAALLACRERLRRELGACANADDQAALRILVRAVEEPLRTIVSNAGYEAAAALAQLQGAPSGHAFDVRGGDVVPATEAGILDVAAAQKAAARAAISGAATALTVDAVVHRRNPDASPGRP